LRQIAGGGPTDVIDSLQKLTDLSQQQADAMAAMAPIDAAAQTIQSAANAIDQAAGNLNGGGSDSSSTSSASDGGGGVSLTAIADLLNSAMTTASQPSGGILSRLRGNQLAGADPSIQQILSVLADNQVGPDEMATLTTALNNLVALTQQTVATSSTQATALSELRSAISQLRLLIQLNPAA
jgi:hypothetical protein